MKFDIAFSFLRVLERRGSFLATGQRDHHRPTIWTSTDNSCTVVSSVLCKKNWVPLSINQSMDQSHNHIITQSINQSMDQSHNRIIIRSLNRSINQSIDQYFYSLLNIMFSSTPLGVFLWAMISSPIISICWKNFKVFSEKNCWLYLK